MGHFCPNLGKNEFQLSTIVPKPEKKLLENTELTDRQTDKTDHDDFKGPSIQQGSNKQV